MQSKKNITSEGHWNSYHSVHDQWTTVNILHGFLLKRLKFNNFRHSLSCIYKCGKDFYLAVLSAIAQATRGNFSDHKSVDSRL